MSERYGRLFALPENLYAEGSPVIVAAGALLKDNQTGKVLAQLKFRSISDKIIKALKVKITPMDTVSQPLGSEVAYQYLDLKAHRDQEFGQKSPISLPDAATRGFSAAVCEVIFSDNTIWQSGGEPWEHLKKPVPLYIPVPDEELQKQLRLEYGDTFAFMPDEDRDLWMCACGNWNRQGELTCYRCNQERSRLFSMDMDALKAKRDERLAKEAAQAEQARLDAKIKAKKAGKLAAIVLPIAAVVIVAAVLISGSMNKKAAYQEAMTLAQNEKFPEAIAMLEEAGYEDVEELVYGPAYEEACKLMESGDYEAAKVAFAKLGNYADSYERRQEAFARAEEIRCQATYEEAEKLLAQGETAQAAIAFGKIAAYQDARERSFALWDEIVDHTISAGGTHTVGLKADGTVVAVGSNDNGQCNVSGWTDIVAFSAGSAHTVGLKADGTVVAVGYNGNGQCNVSDWSDIVAVSAGWYHTVGLRADGTVVAVGGNDFGQCNVSDWTDIVTVSATVGHTVGLKADGTVVAVGYSDDGRSGVSDWTDIMDVSAGFTHTVGLKANGTVVATNFYGIYYYGQCDVSDWTDIVAVSAAGYHTVGLKADGTVVAVGYGDNPGGRCDVSDWTDIVAVFAGDSHTVGLKSDGTVVAVGNNVGGQCNISDWSNIKLP